MNLPDYSEWLNKGERLKYIESEWKRNKYIHENQANVINELLKQHNRASVLEIGCATGNLAELINTNNYTGVDKNEDCIEIALTKNPKKHFITGDIRTVETNKSKIVCAFAIMKHFGLHEWDSIMRKITSLSNQYVIFDIPINEYTYDDGEKHGHHHTWLSEDDLLTRLDYLGLDILTKNESNKVEPIYICVKR